MGSGARERMEDGGWTGRGERCKLEEWRVLRKKYGGEMEL